MNCSLSSVVANYFSHLQLKIHFPAGQPPDGRDVLWRVEAKRYSYVVDADREEYGTTAPRIEAWWFTVHKRTPKGAWIPGRFVLLTATKQFACETLEEAITSFRERTKKHIRILQGRASVLQYGLDLLDAIEGNNKQAEPAKRVM